MLLLLACMNSLDGDTAATLNESPLAGTDTAGPVPENTTLDVPEVEQLDGIWTREHLGFGWSGSTDCIDWQIVDLTGDEVLELVFTRDCTRTDGAWLVTPFDGSGAYAWPAPGPDGQLMDIDQDGRMDLVDDWTVYTNDGAGFGEGWPHPRPDDHACDDYELMDLDGDSRPDLLSDCGAQFANGDGWDEPVDWHTPILLENFALSDGYGVCNQQDMTWRMADLDGDGWAELVVLGICATEQARVYAGSPLGWTETRDWSLPEAPADADWRLVDADGREHLDIVVGDSVWLSTGTGFNAQPVGPNSASTGWLVGHFQPDGLGLLVQYSDAGSDRWLVDGLSGMGAPLDPQVQPEEPLPQAPYGATLDLGGAATCVDWTAAVLEVQQGLSVVITDDCDDPAMGVLYVDVLSADDGSRTRLSLPTALRDDFGGVWSRLVDVDGDGGLDLLQSDGVDWFTSLRTDRGWQLIDQHAKPAYTYNLRNIGKGCSSGKSSRSSSGVLMDIDGDGRADQVWTKDQCGVAGGGASTSTMKVKLDDGEGGYHEPFAMAAPSGVSLNLSARTTSACSMDGRILDVDDDGLLDILQPCDDTWSVYYGNGTGWDDAQDWTLPTTSEPLDGLDGSVECSSVSGRQKWDFFQADAHPGPDLVFYTDRCDGTRTVGTDYWRVHSNTGAGFDDAWTELELPTAPNPNHGYPGDSGTATCNGGTNSHTWEVLTDPLALPVIAETEDTCHGTQIGDRAIATLPL